MPVYSMSAYPETMPYKTNIGSKARIFRDLLSTIFLIDALKQMIMLPTKFQYIVAIARCFGHPLSPAMLATD